MADADTGPRPLDEATLISDIDRTREELARTIDAISDRVSPKRNVDRAMEQIRENLDRALVQVRQQADRTMEQAGDNVDRALVQVRQRADRTVVQVRQGVSEADPVTVGVAAGAVAVAATVVAVVLWRRRR